MAIGGEPWRAFARLWTACRGGMGRIAHGPGPGGVGDQAAWMVDALAALGGIDAALDAARQRLASGQVKPHRR